MALITLPLPAIRVITTGSMQSRFSVAEEVAIVDGSDSNAKVLRDRLLNAKCADLDSEELIYGIAYLVNYFKELNILGDIDPIARTNKLLEDGTQAEKYLGV